MREASFSQGSAPVAIVLALALAATVGVSAQSWNPRGPVKAPPAHAVAPEGEGASLLRVLADWATGRGRVADCAPPTTR